MWVDSDNPPPLHPFAAAPAPPAIRINLTCKDDPQPHQVFTSFNGYRKYLKVITQDTNTEFDWDNNLKLLVLKGKNDDDLQLARDRIAVVQEHLTRPRQATIDFVLNASDGANLPYRLSPVASQDPHAEPRYRIEYASLSPVSPTFSVDGARLEAAAIQLMASLKYASTLNFDLNLSVMVGKTLVRNVSPDSVDRPLPVQSLDLRPEQIVFETRLAIDFLEAMRRISTVFPQVTPITSPTNPPATLYSYEIVGEVPASLLDDVSDFMMLPKTRGEMMSRLQNDSTGGSGRVERVEIRMYIYPDQNNPAEMQCRRVTVHNWDVLSSYWTNPGRSWDAKLCLRSGKLLRPNLCATLLQYLVNVMAGISAGNNYALTFANHTPELKIHQVRRREKAIWTIDNETDVELFFNYEWMYALEQQIEPSPIPLTPIHGEPVLFTEFLVVPTRIRASLIQGSHIALGETAMWNPNVLLPNPPASLMNWLKIAHVLGSVLEDVAPGTTQRPV